MLGLGGIGFPIARRLARTFEVIGYDPVVPVGEPAAHLRSVGSVNEVAAEAETIVLCLPSPQIDIEVVSAILDASDSLATLFIDLSTIGVSAAEKITGIVQRRGHAYVDAPISGSIPKAAAGELTVMAAGQTAHVEAATPVLQSISTHLFVLGERPGLGQAMKLANNIINATAMAVTCEAVAFGTRLGLDIAQMIEVLNVSTGRTSASVDKFPASVVPRTFDFGAHGEIIYKDAGLFLDEARAIGAIYPVAEASEHRWGDHVHAHPHVDATNLYRSVDEGSDWTSSPV
jgi:3-hydroxyisobutyrate dehydrogenase